MPKLREPVIVRFAPEQKAALMEVARNLNLSMAEVVRVAVAELINTASAEADRASKG